MTRLQHCAFVAVTIVALGTTITSLSHPRGREAPLDVPELELHTPPHPGDPIGFDANGTQCLFEANLDALGAYRDAYVEKKLPLCPTTSAGRRMQDGGFFVVTSAIIPPYCDNVQVSSFTRTRTLHSLQSCQACLCRPGHFATFTWWDSTKGECMNNRAAEVMGGVRMIKTFTCQGGQLEVRGSGGPSYSENKFFCNDNCNLVHGCTAVEG